MASLEISRTTEPEECGRWNEAVLGQGGGYLFSTTQWAETVASAVGCSWTLYLCHAGEELLGGAIVLDEGGSGGLRRAVVTPAPIFSPHLFLPDNLGPARKIPRGVAVLSHIERRLREDYRAVSLSTPPGLLDLRAFSWSGWRVRPRPAFSLGLPAERGAEAASAEEESTRAEDLLTRLAVERGYGVVYQVRSSGGVVLSLLVVRDGHRICPLAAEGVPSRCGPREVIAIALALAGLPEADGAKEILFAGKEWEDCLGLEEIGPLAFVSHACASWGRGAVR